MRLVDDEARRALDDVVCPCSAGMGRTMSITEMGIVRRVSLDEAEVGVVVELTDPTCPFGLSIADDIERQLKRRGDERRVAVSFETSDEFWTEERLDKSAAMRLEMSRKAHRD